MIAWNDLTRSMPEDKKFVLLKGDSQSSLFEVFLTIGRTDNEYRPPYKGEVRWLDVQNNTISDNGWTPTHWAYIPKELEL